MPNKVYDGKVIEPKVVAIPGQVAPKIGQNIVKLGNISGKTIKDTAMSPTAPSSEPERTELLGSLTTQQQQRTSARVIKKLRLEPDKDKRKRPDGAEDVPECETPSKIEDPKFPTVKQRMPKALWSTDEKNLFFEALNEYGKDFDAITAYICAKMKKKGMTDANLKTKSQVSHFYYRTWHKLSKHVHFDENVKKVAQELYALINYGELRKKLVSVSEKTCSRLGEMVRCGSIVVRARGRNLRVRTPMCAALRRLNMMTERGCGARVCSRAEVCLRARDAASWARVQAAAHNPRARATLPLRTPLRVFLNALAKRWAGITSLTHIKQETEKSEDGPQEEFQDLDDEEREDLSDHLSLETDRMITQGKKLSLHLGPRPDAEIHIPTITECEQLSSQKICFSSYLERMCSKHGEKGGVSKIRTTKRQRKDSTTEKDKETDAKKPKVEENDQMKLINIDETAIDGIELMASYKNSIDDEEKPSTEDEKEIKSEETAEDDVLPENQELQEKDRDRDMSEKDIIERDKDMSEKEKDSFSELEDDEKFNKSDTDNESDHGKEKSSKETKFKNLKVKFRIRPKKRGRSEYTMVMEKDQDDQKGEESKGELKVEDSKEEDKSDVDLDMAIKQVRKGWSVSDAGDLTIGDLYLMFGSRSKLELDYWWAESTPPLPPKLPVTDKDRITEKKEKPEKTPDKDSSIDESERARESDTELFSPKNVYGQDSNDGLSGDERKSEQQASPEHKTSSSNCSGTFKLVSKLINRPTPPPQNNTGFAQLTDRLKRLLALAGNPHVTSTVGRCRCGHVCSSNKKQPQKQPPVGCIPGSIGGGPRGDPAPHTPLAAPVFRHPTPIAPRTHTPPPVSGVSLEGVPRWRRGRPRADRRVVVQRLLPLLPKLPCPETSLIPVKVVSGSPPPPRILPKPPPTSTSDLSFFYVLSESNGQFFFHDGDRRIPITSIPENHADGSDTQDEEIKEEYDEQSNDNRDEKADSSEGLSRVALNETQADPDALKPAASADIANFLPSESMSLSPSRLLRDSEWLEGSVQDFSLSSFLGHLEGRPPPDGAVDSQLHSLMAESSVDYVAKFADLAAEVTDEANPLPANDLTQ